jgi:hypothetical protein
MVTLAIELHNKKQAQIVLKIKKPENEQ